MSYCTGCWNNKILFSLTEILWDHTFLSGVGLHKIHCIFKVHVERCTRLYFKGIQAVRIEFEFLLKVAYIQCFILIAVDIFQNIIRK